MSKKDSENGTSTAMPDFSTAPSDAPSNGATSGVIGQAQDKLAPVVDQVKGTVGPALGQAQQKTGELAGQVQQQAKSRLDEQKAHTADGLGAVAESLRQTGQQLRDQDQGVVAQYAAQYGDTAAQQVERLSSYLRDKDVNQIMREAEDFARREPAIFIGGAFFLGLLGARFLKSSAPAGSTASSTASAPNYYAPPPSALPAPVTTTSATTTSEFSGVNDLDLLSDAGSGNGSSSSNSNGSFAE